MGYGSKDKFSFQSLCVALLVPFICLIPLGLLLVPSGAAWGWWDELLLQAGLPGVYLRPHRAGKCFLGPSPISSRIPLLCCSLPFSFSGLDSEAPLEGEHLSGRGQLWQHSPANYDSGLGRRVFKIFPSIFCFCGIIIVLNSPCGSSSLALFLHIW